MSERRLRRRPGENRARLLEAGLHEFGLLGYHGASTSGIAARAEVPQPHLYANFGSKLELFTACLAQLDARVAAAHDPVLTSAEALLYYQAIAALGHPELAAALRPHTIAVATALGSRGSEAALVLGASFLMRSMNHREPQTPDNLTTAKDAPHD